MKIIFNSDVLWPLTYALTESHIPPFLREFFRKVAELDSVIVIPQTTQLELERGQDNKILREIEELKTAYKKLNMWGITHTYIDPTYVVRKPHIISLIEDCGVKVIIEKPTFEDFEEAHKRACLRLDPHPNKEGNKNNKNDSDEMRDLIIWVMANRISKNEKTGAILISQDKVHSGSLGDIEARRNQLFRAKNIDEALEFLNIETPGEQLFKNLFAPIWEDLKAEGFPITEPIQCRFHAISFIQDNYGISKALGKVIINLSGGSVLKADAEVTASQRIISNVILSNIIKNNASWEKQTINIFPNKPYTSEESDYAERYKALKETIDFGG